MMVHHAADNAVAWYFKDPRGGLVDVEVPVNLFKIHAKSCGVDPQLMRKMTTENIGKYGLCGDPVWHQCPKCKKCVLAHLDGQPPTKID